MTRYQTACIVLSFAGVAATNAGVIWQEAETLADTGGWSNDSQHVDLMGSPYLLATGTGFPVSDVVGYVKVEEVGSYRLWVRCRDWYPSHSPGQFRVSVDGKNSNVTFGQAADDSWQWIDGGTFEMEAGQCELRLKDLTGWWGRCDVIVLATDGFEPSNDAGELARQRMEHSSVSAEVEDAGEFDVVVVGGGSSGLGAAIAAARNGAKVAFVQDRPVLGGNGSSEIMVPPMGQIGRAPDKVNVSGIAEEIYPVEKWTNFGDSDHFAAVVAGESNISLFLNTRATDVEMVDDSTIGAVLGLNVHTGRRLRFPASFFIDTTGHGWIGHYAGAAWRMGTEGRSEFGESMAPLEANSHTMGNSLYRADFVDMGQADPFETPAWAYQWQSPDDFVKPLARIQEVIRPEDFDKAERGPGRPINTTGSKRGGAFTWYVETGGMSDTINDAEKIRDELFRIHVGLWGYSKNADPKGIEANRNLRMVWLNYVPGVRESRRLVGDYIMTQEDYDEQRVHPDTVAFTDWGTDDHHPHGYFTKGIDVMHVYGGKRIEIPYRSLYSKNIGNLLMAGRCMSASHIALSGVRVQRPMAATGQAAGTAAAIAARHGTTPRGVYEDHLAELQQTLIKDGCFLPGIRSEDPLDLARSAKTKYPVLIDGWNREIKGESRPVPWRGEPIEFRFDESRTVACVHVSLANRHIAAEFAVEAFVGGDWEELARTPGEHAQRRFVINVGPVETDRVRFQLVSSSAPASVAEVRIYSEPGDSTEDGLPRAAGFPTVMDNAPEPPLAVKINFPGIVVDDRAAELTGVWMHSTFGSPVVGGSFQHDGARADGGAAAVFTAELPEPGQYEVRLAYVAHGNRATAVPVTITHAGGSETVIVNQRKKPPINGQFISLGRFEFGTEGVVEITNKGTKDGHVIADGVQFLSPSAVPKIWKHKNFDKPMGRDGRQPNLLFIFADDIGYEALNCYGGLDFKAPHLNRMAADGMRFSRAYTSPVCTPSRVSMHTSLYVTRHGHTGVLPVHQGTDKIVDFGKMPTYAQLLRENGYATSTTGKWQLATLEVWPDHIRESGFDSWCIWQIWKDGAKTLRHWNATFNEDGVVRDDIAERFGPDVLAEYVVEQMTEAKDTGIPFLIVHNELLPHDPIIDTPDDRALGREATLGNMINYMDKLVGQLLQAVVDLGIRDNTYVVFMGDNGTHEEDFNNPRAGQPDELKHTRHTEAGRVDGGKFKLGDAGSHVPLIVWGPPAVPTGSVCDDLADVVDLFPTFCELSGTVIPEQIDIDGRSIAAQIHGKAGIPRHWVHHGLSVKRGGENLFDGKWRLFRRNGEVWDARKLPAEPRAAGDDPAAEAARTRLGDIFEKIAPDGPRPPEAFGGAR